MDDSGRIYHSENPNPADVARLDGFVKALKETGSLAQETTLEQAVKAIGERRAATMGAFGAAKRDFSL